MPPHVRTAARPWSERLLHLVPDGVARDTSLLFAGFSTRVLAQAFGFVLLARALGPADLGRFSAVLAVTVLLSPFVELGAYNLAVRDVTAGVEERRVIGNTLALTACALPPALFVLLAVGRVALPGTPWTAVAAVGVGNLLGARLTSLFRGIFVGRGEVLGAALIEAVTGVVYLAGALVLGATSKAFSTWTWIYCAQYVAVGVGGVAVLLGRFGVARWSGGAVRARVAEGVHFGIGAVAQSANAELDKALLARLAALESAGVYAASTRALAVAIAPAMAFFGAIYRRFFRAGAAGLPASRRFAFQVAPAALAYGLLAWATIALAAPVLAHLFGKGFAETASTLRWIAPLVAIEVLTYPFLDALTGAGLQPLRTAAQVCALGVGVVLNVLLDPRLGWRGAAIASLVSQGALLTFAVVAAPWAARVTRIGGARGKEVTAP
ncbi:lipopolysaccharide biosynthesis protein [Anaeromyxobacter oryzae]|uniref:lipopolysaccharide biosynthesis protein n=1 Tax=Anaeromyxobacter oryzae TaxID=2918170 RepID=UPI0020BF6303|nr:oligosaccharide flippase family protein [Anaeromyxobacter oryzae]